MPPSLPRLTVVPVSDSFASVWPLLATECGFELLIADRLSVPDGDVIAVNSAGLEDTIGGVLTRLGSHSDAILAVGAVTDYRVAIAAVRAGAAEYFALPQDLGLLRGWLQGQAEQLRLKDRSASLAAREAARYRFDGILGESQALKQTLERAARISSHSGVTVLIHGETGTGKGLVARTIHYNGPRNQAAFVDVNCAAIPAHLLESELFGHERDDLVNAGVAKVGLFEVANGGTIFLDEVGCLSLALQGKLLRVLEAREIRRVGGAATIPVDVRVIAATRVDLAESSQRGEFREDLYFRLSVVGLSLPALRERAGDILLLAGGFLRRFAGENGVPVPQLSPAAEGCLMAHPWTGNIPELRNVIERATLLANGNHLDVGDLGLDTTRPETGAKGVPFPATMSEITRAAAHAMTRLCEGNKSEAARRLRISRTRLLRLLAPWGRRPALAEGA